MAAVLGNIGLPAVGGFTPLLLHVAGHDPLPEDQPTFLAGYDATAADVFVLSAVSGLDGYDSRPELDEGRLEVWLLDNLDLYLRRGRRSTTSGPSCIPMSGRWSRAAPRCSAGARGVRRSRSAWIPATC